MACDRQAHPRKRLDDVKVVNVVNYGRCQPG